MLVVRPRAVYRHLSFVLTSAVWCLQKTQPMNFSDSNNIFGKFAAIIGPVLFGAISIATGKANYGVSSIIILFIIGAIIFPLCA